LATNDDIFDVAARAAEALTYRGPVRPPLKNALQNRPDLGGHFAAARLDRRVATANLSNTVSVLAVIIIDRLHIGEHELLSGVGIGCPYSRIQLKLLFDKNRHCVRIIGNDAPQVVVSQLCTTHGYLTRHIRRSFCGDKAKNCLMAFLGKLATFGSALGSKKAVISARAIACGGDHGGAASRIDPDWVTTLFDHRGMQVCGSIHRSVA
jgi:hypothetical protein